MNIIMLKSPDYVNLSYDFIIWTTYIQQMNSIVEKIQYSEGVIVRTR